MARWGLLGDDRLTRMDESGRRIERSARWLRIRDDIQAIKAWEPEPASGWQPSLKKSARMSKPDRFASYASTFLNLRKKWKARTKRKAAERATAALWLKIL